MGFGVPLGIWLRNDLKEWANDLLSTHMLNKTEYLNSENIKFLFS